MDHNPTPSRKRTHQSNETPSPIANLPDDLLVPIFVTLPLLNIFLCERVCKQWCSAIRYTNHLWKSKIEALFPPGCLPAVWRDEKWRDLAWVMAAWSRPWSAVTIVEDPPIHVSPDELAELPPNVFRTFVCARPITPVKGATDVNSSGNLVWYLRGTNLRDKETYKTDLLRPSSDVHLATLHHRNPESCIHQVRRSHWRPVINSEVLSECGEKVDLGLYHIDLQTELSTGQGWTVEKGSISVYDVQVCGHILKTVHCEWDEDGNAEDPRPITTFWRIEEDGLASQQTSSNPETDVPNVSAYPKLTVLWSERTKDYDWGEDEEDDGPFVDFHFNETIAVKELRRDADSDSDDDDNYYWDGRSTEVNVHLIALRITDQQALGETKFSFNREHGESYTLTRTHFLRFHQNHLIDVMSLPSLTVLHTINLGNITGKRWTMGISDDETLLFLTTTFGEKGASTLMLDVRNQKVRLLTAPKEPLPGTRGVSRLDGLQPPVFDGFYVFTRDYAVEEGTEGTMGGSVGPSAEGNMAQGTARQRAHAGCAYVDTVYFRQNPVLGSDDLADGDSESEATARLLAGRLAMLSGRGL